jgi:DNA-binding LytR/AlgR family response regulator
MHAIEERLNTANFIRVHRSYVVNMQHANHYEKGKIILGKYEIQVSESGKEKLKAYINQRLVNK